MKYLSVGLTDIGITREINQDAWYICSCESVCGSIVMAVVCDGVGGFHEGEYASRYVVQAFATWFYQAQLSIFTRPITENVMREEWGRLIEQVNRDLQSQPGKRMGTTVSALLLTIDCYYVVHVGDSRIYRISEGAIQQITEDQSFVAREVAAGRMTKEQAKVDSRRNVILQCIGGNGNIEPAFYSGFSFCDSAFLLCSDGFVHELSEEEYISQLCPTTLVDEEMIRRRLSDMIEIAKERQEHDNITACIVNVRGED